jgi:hypothetical protein
MTDNISFYDDETLQKWYNELTLTDYLVLSWIPFSFYEIQRELIRRENVRFAAEDWL